MPRKPVISTASSPWRTIPQPESASPSENESQHQVPGNDMLNVQLMHHFITSTCQTLAKTHKLRSIWRIKIPKIGFEHRYVLDMIFAISAVHLSRDHNYADQSHMAYAFRLYEDSLKLSSVAISQISPANCEALYAFSILALVFEFGTLHTRESLLFNRDGSLAHWIVHSRGIHAIIGSAWHEITSGPLKPMLECSFLEAGPADIEPHLQKLRSHIEQDILLEAADVHLLAINELIYWSRLANVGFYGWLCRFSDGYGDLLSRKDPYALIIFGYACVVLKYGDPAYWINGYPEKLLCEIYGYLNISLRSWLHWPMMELGIAW